MFLQLSDDDDDLNSTDVDITSELDYETLSYLRHPNGWTDYQLPSDWNNYIAPVESSGNCDIIILTCFFFICLF